MGNTQGQGMNVNKEYQDFIKEQSRIIQAQQEHINSLSKGNTNTNTNTNTNMDMNTNVYSVIEERDNLQLASIEGDSSDSLKKMDQVGGGGREDKNISSKTNTKLNTILKIFDINEDYDEAILKKAFLKLALIHHPDRGGKSNNFKKIQIAYKYLLNKLSEKDNDKDHNRFKKEYKEYASDQEFNTMGNINLSEKFDKDVFNKIYDEHRINSVYDKGYSEWISSNPVYDIDVDPHKPKRTDINLNNFNEDFNKNRNKRKESKSLIQYDEPIVDISFKGKDSLMLLGQSEVSDFSGECNSGLSYRDYKDAYTNSCLIDIESVDISKRSKNIKEHNKERKNISYIMSDKDLEKQELTRQKELELEEKRRKRLENSDRDAFNSYEAIHHRMLGR